MKIIVGLGNPGRKYERTRHNAGFMAVDDLAQSLHFELSLEKCHALFGKGALGTEKVLLAKPQTYMNDSGRSVAALLKDAYATANDLIVLHDELDLPAGVVRVKIGGGHGGHNGLRSIIDELGTEKYSRLRVGIGEPGRGAVDHVLSRFAADERKRLRTLSQQPQKRPK